MNRWTDRQMADNLVNYTDRKNPLRDAREPNTACRFVLRISRIKAFFFLIFVSATVFRTGLTPGGVYVAEETASRAGL
ncbi:hypothetical protein BO79DRAFT_14418 [Aspergillus costaricaensis CBS 115574]|uniref:Uncharacterized protein n=1 Tax=Aspergillus costaricaensis CBS 115574 TaxID=1448317 RepID=A0ACD1IE07_9EURO|nr:hypothetical protein BO79DRAFT_14418 [Aspergillus costaricaensis CBS 115574]RAK88838.1 hypothetical protein BO79DRAFT_14418 [Aspergillus costaricaensis CBS 115574]